MPLQENKKRMLLLSRLSVLVVLLLICISVIVLWYESSDAQMRQEQFIQRDESRLEQAKRPPPPVPQAAPAPAPAPVIIQQAPVASDLQIQKLQADIQKLQQQIDELKKSQKNNNSKLQDPQKTQ